MRLGYNTNGLAHHSLPAAIELLAEIGYRSVAITLDHATLNPYGSHLRKELADARSLLEKHGMTSVIETGARYLLNPRLKHEPTLLATNAGDREIRIDFLKKSIDIAAELGSQCVSLWSGIVPTVESRMAVMQRLVESLRVVLDYAKAKNVVLAFEPEPGMLIDTMASFQELLDQINSPQLMLTLDVGHLHCLGEVPIANVIRHWHHRLANIHIEDMLAGVHEHLMFGEGELDFPPIIATLREMGYAGPLNVELSRHSHMGPAAAQRAFDFLKPLIERTN
jgi:sugar phosphate isomerase/epimerase